MTLSNDSSGVEANTQAQRRRSQPTLGSDAGGNLQCRGSVRPAVTLSSLRARAGAAQVALDGWELTNGVRPKVGPQMDEHNRLLHANYEATMALRAAETRLIGNITFKSKLKTK